MKRPWARLESWQIGIAEKKWALIGTAGFEDRSVTCVLKVGQHLSHALFLELVPASPRSQSIILEKISQNKIVITNGYAQSEYFQMSMIDPPNDIIEKAKEWLKIIPTRRVIIDMSAMPKRFLAILLECILKDETIEEILVTYTVPEKYTAEPLAEDQGPIRTFPGFSNPDLVDVPVKNVIMGLGYMPFDLTSVMESMGEQPKVNVLFPFPPGSPSFQRNWKLLLNLYGVGEKLPEPIRIDSRDVSYAFEVIENLTNGGTEASLLLPFGPKPHSLAMILHSIKKKSEVRYTQPSFYNPEYSSGVKKVAGREEIYGYAIRLNGKDLYQ